ncbi:PPC domain containing protein [Parasponia andersonii]|uniref:PPC domain containing protein n=1 Tax=Parasponia andersonii TaxID=3476 RepID=A0A2P5DR66_PARAD|nr:PPC domain containing protein [Parasponia andersonii]
MADYGGAITLAQARDLSHTSDDDSSDRSPRSVRTLSGGGGGGGGGGSATSSKVRRSAGGNLSSPAGVQKKPRGRPPGSKNKPKPPVVITKDSDSAMRPVVLEVSAGADVVQTVIEFARRRRVGFAVMSGTGSVSTVTLRHPVSHAPAFSLQGPFSLLSLTGSYVGSNPFPSFVASSAGSKPSSPPPPCSSFGVCLSGGQGQVFGGIVGGKVLAASLVVVVGATFHNPTFHRLPFEQHHDGAAEEKKPAIAGAGAGGIGGNEGSGGSTAMSMAYGPVASPTPINCQLSPDVMTWGPNSRSPY